MKKSVQAEIKKFKQNIITDEELYNWMKLYINQ